MHDRQRLAPPPAPSRQIAVLGMIRTMAKRIGARFFCLITSAAFIGVGCFRGDVGKPTDQEVMQMQAWAEVVTPQDRQQVTREANQHTDWAERRKVQFITGEYKRRYLHQQAHPTTAHAVTPSTSAPTNVASPGGL